MARQTINVGTSPNARDGDPIRSAFQKVNANFTELYNTAGADIQIPAQTGNSGKYLTTNGTTLSWVTPGISYTASTTAPTISAGALWFNTEEGKLYVNYNNTWVDSNPTEIDPSAIRFNNLNQIELPEGGDIVDVNGNSVLGVTSYNDLTDTPTIPSIGNIEFRNDSMNDINGILITNASQTIQPTATITIPANDSGAPLAINNDDKFWSFGTEGKLTLPAGTTYEYLNAPLTGHGDGLARLDFTLATDGVNANWLAASASPAGSGYSIGDTFTFDAEFLGIPGASVTIEVLTVGAGGSVEDLAFSMPPLYPADIYRDSPINLQVGPESNRWTFGADGTLTLPGDLNVGSNSIREDGLFSQQFSIAAGAGKHVEISSDDGGKVWSFDTTGTLTLPEGSTIGETPAAITVTIYGAGYTAFNQTYTRTYGDPTYADQYLGSNDCRIFRDGGTANKWRLREVSTDYYESDDLVTWTDFIGGGGYIPTGIPSLKTTDITVDTNTWTFSSNGTLILPDDVSSISTLDPAVSGGISGITVYGKDRTFIGIQSETYGWNWDFRAFGLSDFASTSKPAIKFPGSGWLQEDLSEFATGSLNAPLQLGSQGSITLTTTFHDVFSQATSSWIFGTDGQLTVPGVIKQGNSKLDLNASNTGVVNLTSTADDSTSLFLSADNAALAGKLTASITAGEAGQGARTIYEQKVIELDAAFAADSWTGAGYPAGPTSSQALNIAKAMNPLIPDAWITIASQLQTAYDTWQEVLTFSDFSIAVGGNDVVWGFSPTGQLTVPGAIRKDGGLYMNSGGDGISSTVFVNGTAGSVILRTDNGTTLKSLTLDVEGLLTFPDGTTSTGKSITVPLDDSLTVNLSFDSGPGSINTSFKVNPLSIKLPTGNGNIYSNGETAAERWSLDSANKTFYFPDAGDGVSPQIRYSTPGNDGMELFTAAKPIKITTASNKSWTFGTTGTLTLPASGNVVDSTGVGQLANRVEGSWTVTAGTNNYSFTVPANGAYHMWVRGNIPNGIISYVATVHITNPNVPVIGSQRGYNYTDGGSPILLTSMPTQFVGTEGTIATGSISGTTNNVFVFGISNTSGSNQTVYWGYTKI